MLRLNDPDEDAETRIHFEASMEGSPCHLPCWFLDMRIAFAFGCLPKWRLWSSPYFGWFSDHRIILSSRRPIVAGCSDSDCLAAIRTFAPANPVL